MMRDLDREKIWALVKEEAEKEVACLYPPSTDTETIKRKIQEIATANYLAMVTPPHPRQATSNEIMDKLEQIERKIDAKTQKGDKPNLKLVKDAKETD